MKVSRVLESSLYVDDLDAAIEWYQKVLGAELVSVQPDRHAFFRVGEAMILLFIPESSLEEDGVIPTHGASGPGHLAFAMEHEEIQAWRAELAAHHVPIEKELDWPNGAKSLYFRDPSNNSLELATPDLWFASDAEANETDE